MPEQPQWRGGLVANQVRETSSEFDSPLRRLPMFDALKRIDQAMERSMADKAWKLIRQDRVDELVSQASGEMPEHDLARYGRHLQQGNYDYAETFHDEYNLP